MIDTIFGVISGKVPCSPFLSWNVLYIRPIHYTLYALDIIHDCYTLLHIVKHYYMRTTFCDTISLSYPMQTFSVCSVAVIYTRSSHVKVVMTIG